METLPETGVRFLSLGELSCWHIKRHIVSKLTKRQDSVINIHGKNSQSSKQHNSPAGVSIQASVEDSCLTTFLEDHSNVIENQEFPTGRAQNCWNKLCLNGTQNYQRSCKLTPVKNKFCMFVPCADIFSCISPHLDDDTVHKREKAHGNRECGKDLLKASPLALCSIIQTGPKTYQCNEREKGFSDHTSLELHQQIQLGGELFTNSRFHRGEKTYSINMVSGYTRALNAPILKM
eukprot:bmy_22363T0